MFLSTAIKLKKNVFLSRGNNRPQGQWNQKNICKAYFSSLHFIKS